MKKFIKFLKGADYIIISPGINMQKLEISKHLLKNKTKIITDIDLFYLIYPTTTTIAVTGTNGKSTTCKILQFILKKNNFNVLLGGNIGKPLLSLSIKNNSIVIIEISSFQLFYAKYIKPTYALMLNITKDHLDWHKNMQNYIKSKLKIFQNQNKRNFALVNLNYAKFFKQKKFLAKLKIINDKSFFKLKSKIKNQYLISDSNLKNLSFVYEISKIFHIEKNFFSLLTKFKGLPHRHELFFKKGNIKFINDSKATGFEACKTALQSNKNILWIVGGLPKKGDKFNLLKLKKNIIQTYIIGKHISFFKNQIKDHIKYKIEKNLNKAVKSALNDSQSILNKPITILFCPASASYDQFNNFSERGNEFKRLVKLYANRYIQR